MSPSRDDAITQGQDDILHQSGEVSSHRIIKKARWDLIRTMGVPLRDRNFRLLFSGQTISYLGDTFYAVALPWLVLIDKGGPQELGIVLTTYGIARICTLLIGGMLSDQFSPRTLMLLADIMRAGIIALLALLIIWTHLSLWQLCLFTASLGAFQGLFGPASLAIMPSILPDDQLQAGNSLNIASLQVAGLLGSGIAGVVVSTAQSGIALIADALSFVVSAITLAAIRTHPVSTKKKPEEALTHKQADEDSSDQFTFRQLLQRSRMFQGVLAFVIISNLSVGLLQVALPSLAHSVLKVGANGYGFMLSAFGAGILVGGLSTGLLSKRAHRGVIGLLLVGIEAGLISLIPFIGGGLIGVMINLLCLGILSGITNILFFTVLQQKLPRHLLGRSMGTLTFASRISYPFSVAIAGFVIAQLGPTIIFPCSGVLVLLTAITGLSQREMRKL